MYTISCHCSQLAYRYSGKPICCYTCHCTDCQRASGSAFTTNMIVNRSDIEYFSGAAAEFCYEHQGEQLVVTCCRTCSTDLFLIFKSRSSIATILTGTFLDQSWFKPVAHIWTGSAVSWLNLKDGLPSFSGQPDWNELTAL